MAAPVSHHYRPPIAEAAPNTLTKTASHLGDRAGAPVRNGTAAPVSWGLRLFNGRDEQLMTALLPNPFLTRTQQPTPQPVWAQLELWDWLRREHLGLGPDDLDRSGHGFGHG